MEETFGTERQHFMIAEIFTLVLSTSPIQLYNIHVFIQDLYTCIVALEIVQYKIYIYFCMFC